MSLTPQEVSVLRRIHQQGQTRGGPGPLPLQPDPFDQTCVICDLQFVKDTSTAGKSFPSYTEAYQEFISELEVDPPPFEGSPPLARVWTPVSCARCRSRAALLHADSASHPSASAGRHGYCCDSGDKRHHTQALCQLSNVFCNLSTLT